MSKQINPNQDPRPEFDQSVVDALLLGLDADLASSWEALDVYNKFRLKMQIDEFPPGSPKRAAADKEARKLRKYWILVKNRENDRKIVKTLLREARRLESSSQRRTSERPANVQPARPAGAARRRRTGFNFFNLFRQNK